MKIHSLSRFYVAELFLFRLSLMIGINLLDFQSLFSSLSNAPKWRLMRLSNFWALSISSIALLFLLPFTFLDTRLHLIIHQIAPALRNARTLFIKKTTKWFNFEKPYPPSNTIQFNCWDVFLIVILLIFSILFFIERIQWDYPDVFLGGDASNIVSFALANQHPEWYQMDFLLGDPENYQLYSQIHVPYIEWITKSQYIPNPTIALLTLLPVVTFTYLLGLYLLGRVVFQNQIIAFFFMSLNAFVAYLPIDDIGLTNDPLPRNLYLALYVYLILGFWVWRQNPKRWIGIAFLNGLLVYVHAVSYPFGTIFIFSGFLLFLPKDWQLPKKLSYLSLLLLLAFLPAMLFIQVYSNSAIDSRQLPNGVSYHEFMDLFTSYYNTPELHDIWGTSLEILKSLTHLGLLPFGLVGFFLSAFLAPNQKKELKLVFIWLFATVIISIILPSIERVIESYLMIQPLQVELFRNVIFLRFLLILVGLLGISKLLYFIRQPKYVTLPIIFLLLILNLRIYNHPRVIDLLSFSKTRYCILQQHKLFCQRESPLRQAIIYLREQTPIGSPVFFTENTRDTLPLVVRYMAYRPLVYSWKDRGLGFADPQKLLDWYSIYRTLNQYQKFERWLRRDPNSFFLYTKSLGSKYVVLPCPCPNSDQIDNAKVVFTNEAYSIYEIP